MDDQLRQKIEARLSAKGLPVDIAVSFNDVCIIDRKSDIASRRDIGNFKTRLARDIFLNIPIVSANMPDITDSRMAIALARLGGLGFIHQFLPIEKRVEEVKRVKRADSSIIEKPITIRFSERLSDARALMDAYQISGLLVVDEEGKLVGILTSRDMRLQEDLSLYVKEAMTPMPLVVGSPDTTKESARVLLRQYKVEKLPLVDKAGKVAGLITAKDIIKAAQYRSAVRDKKGRLLVGATIGAHRNNILSDVDQLVKAGMDVLLIDTARAFADPVEALLKEIRAAFNELPIVVGNIDRPEAALMLIEAGADAVKVGIGPGSACKTREETGVGTPQLTAIAECAAIADEHHIPVVADGGIRVGADVAKALVAGASAVMLGSLLGGSEEAPGEAFYEEGKKWKIYRGSASLEAQLSRMDGGGLDHVRPTEGIQRRVAYRGEVSSIIEDLVGHLRSSMSYVGAHTLDEFKALGTFRRQTEAGYLEGKPHRNEE